MYVVIIDNNSLIVRYINLRKCVVARSLGAMCVSMSWTHKHMVEK